MSTPAYTKLHRSYLPNDDLSAWEWLTNFREELPRFVEELGVDAAAAGAFYEAHALLRGLRDYARNAAELYHERLADKHLGEWGPPGGAFTVSRATAPTGPAADAPGGAGAFVLAVRLADAALQKPACDGAVRAALGLNPLPRAAKSGPPRFTARIEQGRLTVLFTKGRFRYFMVKIDHGGGVFDTEKPATRSPWRDPTPLPAAGPQIWRVQLVGYVRDGEPGFHSDILDVAARQATGEHSAAMG